LLRARQFRTAILRFCATHTDSHQPAADCRQRKDASALSAGHATSSATSAVWHKLRQMQSAQPADDRHLTGLRQSVEKPPELP